MHESVAWRVFFWEVSWAPIPLLVNVNCLSKVEQLQTERLRSSWLPLPWARWWQEKWTSSLIAPLFSKGDTQKPLRLFPSKQVFCGLVGKKTWKPESLSVLSDLGLPLHFFSCRAAPVLTQGKEPFPVPSLTVVPSLVTATTDLPEDLCSHPKISWLDTTQRQHNFYKHCWKQALWQ